MSRTVQITFDAHDPRALSTFWRDVLDYVVPGPPGVELADGERVPLIGDLVSFTLVRNPGAAFSFATGMTWVLTLVALAVVIGIVRFARRLRSRGWAVRC